MEILEFIQSTQNSIAGIFPELILLTGFLIAFLLDIFFKQKNIIIVTSLLTLIASSIVASGRCIAFQENYTLFNDFLSFHSTSLNLSLIASIASIVIFISCIELFQEQKNKIELAYLFPVFLFSVNTMIFSNHFLMLLISIEFVSILSYIYISYNIQLKSNAESSIKYILYGLLSSAIMLYGLSLLYGFSKDLYFSKTFLLNLSKADASALIIPFVLLSAGILYKISAFPMHYFVPDVYEGSNPKILALISTLPKIAGFALLLNFTQLFSFEWKGMTLVWPNFPWANYILWLSVATMFIGNLSAISQKNLKRIFAYSSISHTGFILIAIASFSNVAEQSLLFYIAIYAISNIAVFILLNLLESKFGIYDLETLKGFFQKDKMLSALFILLLASFIGLPPLAGFIAKFYVFSAAFEQYLILDDPAFMILLISAALNTVISLFYYFNIAKSIFVLSNTSAESVIIGRPLMQKQYIDRMLIALLALILLVFGLFPSYLIDLF